MGLFDMFNPIMMEDEPHVLNEGTDIRRRVDEFPEGPTAVAEVPVQEEIPSEGILGGLKRAFTPDEQGNPPWFNGLKDAFTPDEQGNPPWYSGNLSEEEQAELNGITDEIEMPPPMFEGNNPYEIGQDIRDKVSGAGGRIGDAIKSILPGSEPDPYAQYKFEQLRLKNEGKPYDDRVFAGSGDQFLAGITGREEYPTMPESEIDTIRKTAEQNALAEKEYNESVEDGTYGDAGPHPKVTPVDTEVDPENDPPMTEVEQENAVNDTADASGNPNADVARVVAADSKGWKKAMGWVTDTFGINGQDLARFGLFYAGSRVAGYGHGGSMKFAFNTAMEDSRERSNFTQRASEKGVYTQTSLDQFKRTGDYEDLKLTGTANPTKIDLTKPFLRSDGVRGYVATDKAGNKQFVNGEGRPLNGEFFAEDKPETRRELVNEYSPNFEGVIKDVRGQAGTDKFPSPGDLPNYQITPTEGSVQGAEIILDEANRLGLDVDSAFMVSVFGNAVRASVQDARQGAVVTNLSPYIKSQLRYFDSTDPWAGALDVKGEKMPIKEWFSIQNAMLDHFGDDPEYKEWLKNVGEGVAVDEFMKGLYAEYQGVEDKSEYINREGKGDTGFKTWLKSQLNL